MAIPEGFPAGFDRLTIPAHDVMVGVDRWRGLLVVATDDLLDGSILIHLEPHPDREDGSMSRTRHVCAPGETFEVFRPEA